jgi:FkbM family methyltransferase
MIRLHSHGQGRPNRPQRLLLKLSRFIREALVTEVRLDERGFRSRFRCEGVFEATRPMTLWTKEEGTMRWIDGELRAGDVFMDIGANIGIYTIAAAHRVGPSGAVYAFEPHKANAMSLMRNVVLNGFDDRIIVFTNGLSDSSVTLEFNYSSLASASSGSQLGHSRVAGKDRSFAPVAREMMTATSVDRLIAEGAILPPSLVKIDVDGNELAILKGMRTLLGGADRPRSLQVELNVGEQAPITTFLAELGYRPIERHFTSAGKRASARGLSLDQIAHNAIFQPGT